MWHYPLNIWQPHFYNGTLFLSPIQNHILQHYIGNFAIPEPTWSDESHRNKLQNSGLLNLSHCTVCTIFMVAFCAKFYFCSAFAQFWVGLPDTMPRHFTHQTVCLSSSNTSNTKFQPTNASVTIIYFFPTCIPSLAFNSRFIVFPTSKSTSIFTPTLCICLTCMTSNVWNFYALFTGKLHLSVPSSPKTSS